MTKLDHSLWRILLIDDDEEDYILTRDMLISSRGRAEMDWVANFDAAVEQLAKDSSYDAVLVDYDLGVNTGVELIREFAPRYPAPFILYTGRGSREVDLEARQAGATLYLTKAEANPLLLERAIRYAAEIKQRENELREARETAERELAERRRAEEGLRISEERLRSFMDSTHDVMFALDRGWRFQFANRRFAEVFQVNPDELIGKVFWEVYPIYAGTIVEKQYRKAMEEQVPVHFQLSGFITPAWYEISVYPTRDGISIFTQDRTEEKKARDALRVSEERFSKAFEASPDAITISRVQDGKIENVNSSFERLFGYTAEEVVGKTSTELGLFANPEDRKRAVELLRASGSVNGFELSIRTRSGQERFVSLSVALIDISGDQSMVTIIEDITKRKQVEEDIRESIERERAKTAELETLMDTVPAMIWIARDAQCREMTGNRYGYEFLNMWHGANISKSAPEEDLGQQPYRNFKNGREIPTEELPMQIAAATGEAFTNYDFDLVFRDGTVRSVLGNVNPLWDEKGNPCGAVAVFVDITERRRAEEQLQRYAQDLERSNQALQDFTFIASHDLQEPLRKVQGFGSMLQARFGQELGEEGRDYVTRMSMAASRMKEMLDGLLSYSRVTTQGTAFTEVNLREMAQEVLFDLELRIKDTRAEIELGELPTLQADALQMRQLLQNLIGNALKYHRNGIPPRISITASADGAGQVHIKVRDNGIGFDPLQAGRIFEPFVRLQSHTAYEGTGMGLAICKKIVERHNGTISVESQPGVGSTFTVTLPKE